MIFLFCNEIIYYSTTGYLLVSVSIEVHHQIGLLNVTVCNTMEKEVIYIYINEVEKLLIILRH